MNKLFKALVVSSYGVIIGVIISMYGAQSDLTGKVYSNATPQPAFVVKVHVERDSGGELGSGCLIRSDLVLTCHHVIRDARPGDRITVRFKSGDVSAALVDRVDKTQDLALLRISPVIIPAARPARRGVIKDQDVVICGFPGGSDYQEIRGRVVGFRSPTRGGNDTLFLVSERAESGVSGGPVLNMGGEVVGVLFGSLRFANCTGLEAIKEFLKDVK
jgi:S1-C subfamily serine protease